MDGRKVLVACDKFKGSLTAAEVADRITAGLGAVVPTAAVVRVPVADGGDGTLDAAVAAGFTRVPVTASGPCAGVCRLSCMRSNARPAVVNPAAKLGAGGQTMARVKRAFMGEPPNR